MGKPGISVPKQFKHELRNDSSPEYKVAQIRDYVKAHEGEVIKGEDFAELVGTMAPTYISRLKKQGRLIRIPAKDGGRGARFKWKWIDANYVADAKPSEVKVRTLGFRDYPLGHEMGVRNFIKESDTYVEEHVNILSGEEIRGIIKLKAHLKAQYHEVKKYNESLLEKRAEEE